MAVQVSDQIGTASVTVVWDVMKEEPQIAIEVDLPSAIFPVADCLKSLAAASRRMAAELDQRADEMRKPSPPISDEEY